MNSKGNKTGARPLESRKQVGNKRKRRAQESVFPHLLSPLWGEYKETQLLPSLTFPRSAPENGVLTGLNLGVVT